MTLWIKHKTLKEHEEKTASTGFSESQLGFFWPFHIPSVIHSLQHFGLRTADEKKELIEFRTVFQMAGIINNLHNFSLN